MRCVRCGRVARSRDIWRGSASAGTRCSGAPTHCPAANARVSRLPMIMLSGANLLIFDEPTNHLDVESIEALEDAVERYGGTVLLVSHDRALLRSLVTRVWVLHDERITCFDGPFAEWEVASEERAHAAAVAASEEEALRRVREHWRTERRQDVRTESRAARRAAEQALADVMSRVAVAEADVARITAALAEPSLYTTPDGVTESVELGIALERARRSLDAALEAWAAAEGEHGELSIGG